MLELSGVLCMNNPMYLLSTTLCGVGTLRSGHGHRDNQRTPDTVLPVGTSATTLHCSSRGARLADRVVGDNHNRVCVRDPHVAQVSVIAQPTRMLPLHLLRRKALHSATACVPHLGTPTCTAKAFRLSVACAGCSAVVCCCFEASIRSVKFVDALNLA